MILFMICKDKNKNQSNKVKIRMIKQNYIDRFIRDFKKSREDRRDKINISTT